MTEREALKLALEALEIVNKSDDDCDFMNFECAARVEDAIIAIKESLANHIPDTKQMVAQPEPPHSFFEDVADELRVEIAELQDHIRLLEKQLAQPEQEPVPSGVIRTLVSIDKDGIETWKHEPFYTTPPPVPEAHKRTWVGLTDEEIDQGLLRSDYALKTAEAWRAGVVFAMTKLKEKNT